MTTVLARIDRQSAIWMLLVAATVLTAVLGLEQHGGSTGVGLALLAIAFVKIRLVARHFMDVRDAPVALRLLVDGYCLITFLALAAIYLAQ